MEENKKESRGKVIRSFILRTLLYSLVLLGLIYLYEYCGIGSTGFIYNEF
ncbi:teichoic acid D-Ala incorporation-associated protein DltX [Lactobacillus sp.]